jgi:dTDP-4-dehydrorhamnose reductase
MNPFKILVTGADGQLGTECMDIMGRVHRVYPITEKELDITIQKDVERTVLDLKPDVIVNCAAYTNVDGCETAQDLAMKVNADGPAYLAMAANQINAKLVHISTDYVFNGSKSAPQPYYENDPVEPISVYGKTKLEGENRIKSLCSNYIIARTAWLYGLHGVNFIAAILRLALKSEGKPLKVVNDQHGSPTWARSLAIQLLAAIQNNLNGVFHTTSEGHCTWYDFAVKLLEEFNVKATITPCTSQEFIRPAKRPHNSILENYELKARNLNIMPSWDHALKAFVKEEGQAFLTKLSAPQ